MFSLFALPRGLPARFLKPMGRNVLRMRSVPAISEHVFKFRVHGMDSQHESADVGPRLNSVTLGRRFEDLVQRVMERMGSE